MEICAKCGKKIKKGNLYECPTCMEQVCKSCAEKTKSICPSCYYEYQIKG